MAKIKWPIQEAEKIIKRVKDESQPIVFQTGYGPSGLPHIGTFAEVARTLLVIKALKNLRPDLKTKLIVFSDDMDGLRNLPENVPNHELLRPNLGKPLSNIPDPFQEKESFSGFMNNQLQLFLDSFGFEYEYRSSTDCYKGGIFDDGLKRVMDNYDTIRDIFTRTIAEDKRAAWSPFFPICEKCGKIYSTRVTAVDTENYEISYICDKDGELFESCGHEGKTSITGGNVKVGWKVDWALRWYTFGVNYEMHGKDLMESATMSSNICKILGSKPPQTYKYELFLDENGAKISKKIGNGVSMDQWLAYAPLGALLNFLLGNPNKAKKMGLPILPKLIDEFIQVLKSEDPNEEGCSSWFINAIQTKQKAEKVDPSNEITYSLLLNVAGSLGIHDGSLLYNYAKQYAPSVEDHSEFFTDLCDKVTVYVKGYEETLPKKELNIDKKFIPLLKELHEKLVDLTEEQHHDGTFLQQTIFAIAKDHEMNQRAWFQFLYMTLLEKEQGPKIGPFMAMLGKNKTMPMLDKAVAKFA